MSAQADTSQISLPFTAEESLAEEDFFVSQSNQHAHARLAIWPDVGPESSPNTGPNTGPDSGRQVERCFLLTGPEASGKSHLAAIWKSRTGAVPLSGGDDLSALSAGGYYCIDGANDCGETWLFHAINWVREIKAFLLITWRSSVDETTVGLPDLRSRLAAMPTAQLHHPDDMLLEVVLQKLFADHQLKLSPQVSDYIIKRVDRRLESVRAIVRETDRRALSDRRNVTIPLLKLVFDALDTAQ